MTGATGQVRVVAVWYGLLAAICTYGAVLVISIILAHREQDFGGLGTGLWSYICAAIAFWALGVLSLRYLTLGTATRSAALALSIIMAICTIVAAIGVTLSSWNGRGARMMWWTVAAICTLCAYLLWRRRRASNNRSSGRDA
jgi:hypothetical protein